MVESSGRALLVIRLGSSTAGAITATQALIPSKCDTAVVCLTKEGESERASAASRARPPIARRVAEPVSPHVETEPATVERRTKPAARSKTAASSRGSAQANKQRDATPPQDRTDES